MTTLYDNNTIGVAIDNLSNQLVAFQKTILARAEELQFPTMEDLALQSRIISCLDKLRKFLPKGDAQKAVTDFINVIRRGNEGLADIVSAEYDEYLCELKERRERAMKKQEQVVASCHEAPVVQEGHKGRISILVTEEDFNDYKHLLGEFKNSPDNTQVNFRGRYVNARWFDYNMFQYTLPAETRRFIDDADRILRTVDKKDLYESISKYHYNRINVAA